LVVMLAMMKKLLFLYIVGNVPPIRVGFQIFEYKFMDFGNKL